MTGRSVHKTPRQKLASPFSFSDLAATEQKIKQHNVTHKKRNTSCHKTLIQNKAKSYKNRQ